MVVIVIRASIEAMARMAMAVLVVVVVAAAALAGGATAQLKEGFYEHTCPQAEKIVKDYVKEHIPHAPSVAATLLRTHFHDCFVRVRNVPRPSPRRPAVVLCSPGSAAAADAFCRAATRRCCSTRRAGARRSGTRRPT